MAEFFHMGGYAFYVWTSYAVVAVLLVYHFIAPRFRLKQLIREIANTPGRRKSQS